MYRVALGDVQCPFVSYDGHPGLVEMECLQKGYGSLQDKSQALTGLSHNTRKEVTMASLFHQAIPVLIENTEALSLE